MDIRSFRQGDEAEVIALWRRCALVRPQNNPREDLRRKAGVDPDLFLVGIIAGEVMATAMAGYEGHRGWINYLAVDPRLQRLGYGRQIMDHAVQLLRQRGCPKVNLQVRSGNAQAVAFYQRLGFAVDDVVSLGLRLETDPPFEIGSSGL